jgi:hypothetical protein
LAPFASGFVLFSHLSRPLSPLTCVYTQGDIMSTSLFPVDRRQALVALSAMAVGGSALAQSRPAESFPTKPIQLVLPFPPGGSMTRSFVRWPTPRPKNWANPWC